MSFRAPMCYCETLHNFIKHIQLDDGKKRHSLILYDKQSLKFYKTCINLFKSSTQRIDVRHVSEEGLEHVELTCLTKKTKTGS